MILEKIAAATAERVALQKKAVPLQELKKRMPSTKNIPFAFEKALRTGDIAFICEVKKASPSKGIISEDFPYLQIALDYEQAGAAALSVLTEPEFFMGKDEYLTQIKGAVKIPVLRKDFTVDPYQIYESRAIGADAVLLICALLDTATLREYIQIADTLGLSCLVEAHTETEVHSALRAGARIIGVNNRNLRTFEVDVTNGIALRGLVPPDILFVSESGIKTPEDIEVLRKNRVHAALVGETLMRAPDKRAALELLRGIS